MSEGMSVLLSLAAYFSVGYLAILAAKILRIFDHLDYPFVFIFWSFLSFMIVWTLIDRSTTYLAAWVKNGRDD